MDLICIRHYMGVSEEKGPEYSTLNNSMILIITIPKYGTPNLQETPTLSWDALLYCQNFRVRPHFAYHVPSSLWLKFVNRPAVSQYRVLQYRASASHLETTRFRWSSHMPSGSRLLVFRVGPCQRWFEDFVVGMPSKGHRSYFEKEKL